VTAVAYRAGVMAADSVGWTCNLSVAVPVAPKIKRLRGGGLIAAAGQTVAIDRFVEWMLRGGGKPEGIDRDDLTGLWVHPDGSVWMCLHDLHFIRIHSEFFAIGAPSTFMMGALFAGATAEESVRLAIAHTDGAGGSVQVEHIHAGDPGGIIKLSPGCDPRSVVPAQFRPVPKPGCGGWVESGK